ncbi:MAG TPA: NADPH-dependent F420 reductase [Bryobacteraceae bacterium]|nr:NADPH-dependent F420 reductase [Bryobacteraceae bacterium]
MKISILGAGNVGNALAGGWKKAGHQVLLGARNPEKNEVSVREAAQSANVLVLAVPATAVADAIRAAGDLTGKIILDATNPLLPDLSGLDMPGGISGGERTAALAKVPVVKIFNNTGYPNMIDADYHGERVTMFYCGDDENAKKIAAELAKDLGFDPVDAGPLTQARLLEPLALLWISLALKQGLGKGIAFKLMRR